MEIRSVRMCSMYGENGLSVRKGLTCRKLRRMKARSLEVQQKFQQEQTRAGVRGRQLWLGLG